MCIRDRSNATVGSPVALNGTATDNVGVGEAFLAVKRLSDKLWLRLDGSFGAYQRHPTTLTNPGGASTDWDLSLALGSGDYRVYLVVFDSAGNQDPTNDQHKFTVN